DLFRVLRVQWPRQRMTATVHDCNGKSMANTAVADRAMADALIEGEELPIVAAFAVRRRAYLAPDGTVLGQLPRFASDTPLMASLYRAMVRARAFDLNPVSLQRPGARGPSGVAVGQEAVAVGVASAMDPQDVLLPSYRDNAALLWRGMKMEEILLFWGGDERGSLSSGPAHDFPYSIPVGS